jgi:hypothetical protein
MNALSITLASLLLLVSAHEAPVAGSELSSRPPDAAEWSVAIWTKTGVAEGWPLGTAQDYCDQYAEKVAARWAQAAPAPKTAFLRVVVGLTRRVTVDVMPVGFVHIGDRLTPAPLPLAVLEEVLSQSLPPLGPPISPSGNRMLLLLFLPRGQDFDKEFFALLGMPVGAFPVPDSRSGIIAQPGHE